MKRIEDIERMEAEELETAARLQEIQVPEGLQERLKTALAARCVLEKRRTAPQWAPYAAIAAAAAVAALVLVPGHDGTQPQDTFDDPYLAYTQVEEAFRTISEKMAVGVELAARAGQTAEKPVIILEKINEK